MSEAAPTTQREPLAVYTIKGTQEWRDWFNKFSAKTRIPRAALVDTALVLLARRHRFEAPPQRVPDRY